MGVGTNEIEHDAKKRAVQRWVKLGKCVEGTSFDSEKLDHRDEDYIKGLLKLRADQIRKDWKILKENLEMSLCYLMNWNQKISRP